MDWQYLDYTYIPSVILLYGMMNWETMIYSTAVTAQLSLQMVLY